MEPMPNIDKAYSMMRRIEKQSKVSYSRQMEMANSIAINNANPAVSSMNFSNAQ